LGPETRIYTCIDGFSVQERNQNKNYLKKGTKKTGNNRGFLAAEETINVINPAVDLKSLALNALEPIRGKLQCLRGSIPGSSEGSGGINNAMSTSSAVEALIRDATSAYNLVSNNLMLCKMTSAHHGRLLHIPDGRHIYEEGERTT